MGNIEDPVASPPHKSECSRANGGEESNADETPDDVPVFDTLCEKARKNEEVEVKGSVQYEQQEDYAAKDLMRGF